MRGARGNDFHAYCAGVPLAGGRGLACLSRNEKRLLPPCKDALAEIQAGR